MSVVLPITEAPAETRYLLIYQLSAGSGALGCQNGHRGSCPDAFSVAVRVSVRGLAALRIAIDQRRRELAR